MSMIKWNGIFFQAVAVSLLQYGEMHHLDFNTTQECYVLFSTNPEAAPYKRAAAWPLNFHHINHLRRASQAGHCWGSKVDLIFKVLLWTPYYSHSCVSQPMRTYIIQIYTDTGFRLEDLSKAMDDGEKEPCNPHEFMKMMRIKYFTPRSNAATREFFVYFSMNKQYIRRKIITIKS